MDPVLRAVADHEYDDFSRAVELPFGGTPNADEIAEWRSMVELDRTVAVFDGDEIVGTAAAWSFELTVPGGAAVAAAGVTAVGVRPTHRRRGLLARMMRHQLDDVAARGEPVAVLTASEAAIYGRFGYGAAAFASWWRLDPRGVTFDRDPVATGTFRLVGSDEARRVVPAVFDRARRRHVGAVSRSGPWWDVLLADRAAARRGWPGIHAVVHERDGVADGFVLYRVREEAPWPDHRHVLDVVDLDAVDAAVEGELWRYVCSVDLVTEVRAERRPVDEPLRWRLTDLRRVRCTEVADNLWLRVVDVPAALAARSYASAGAVVIDVDDPFLPANTGRWRVEGGPDGAAVARTRSEPDLALAAGELGSLYLGGVAPSLLGAAGRVTETAPGGLRRADALFVSQPAPWCATDF